MLNASFIVLEGWTAAFFLLSFHFNSSTVFAAGQSYFLHTFKDAMRMTGFCRRAGSMESYGKAMDPWRLLNAIMVAPKFHLCT